MSESEVTLQPAASDVNQWADIFYGLLVAPDRTMRVLSEDESLAANNQTVYGALIIVVLANAISGAVDASVIGTSPSLPILLSAVFQGLVMWLALSAILHIVCGWVSKREVSLRTALICVGWAFMPLIFIGPMSCFRALGSVYNFLAIIPVLWMFYLQWLVFAHSLEVGPVRMFALLVLGPPLFILTYFFWLSCAFIAIVQALL
jgi:hypothetical protein